MRNSDCLRTRIFRTGLGWAGVAASVNGICRIVLPVRDRKAVARELSRERLALHRCRARIRAGVNEMRNSVQKGTNREEGKAGAILDRAIPLLRKYFSGEDVAFDVPLDLRYDTPFQRSVWRAARCIPFGSTRSYGWIAQRIRKPFAARAVGQAMGANPVPVIIP